MGSWPIDRYYRELSKVHSSIPNSVIVKVGNYEGNKLKEEGKACSMLSTKQLFASCHYQTKCYA